MTAERNKGCSSRVINLKKREFEKRCAEMRVRSGQDPTPVAMSGKSVERPVTIKEAAQQLGRSVWWTRRYFRTVDGALRMPPATGARRGTRTYQTITIPVDVLERELVKFRKAA
jgi:hypothetical protein